MIHNCPSHTTQLKQYELSTLRFKDVRGAKQFFQWMLPQLYINLLKEWSATRTVQPTTRLMK